MNTREPILHVNLDEITNKQVINHRDPNQNGRVESPAKIIPDDLFGSCTSLQNGGTITFNQPFELAGDFTLSIWLKGENYPSATKPKLLQILDDNQPLWKFTGPDSVKKIETESKWDHFVFVFIKDTSRPDKYLLKVYENENIVSSKELMGGFIKANKLILGDHETAEKQSPPMNMAALRMYNYALCESQITVLKQDDHSSKAMFEQVYPLDFNIVNDEIYNMLYISDLPEPSKFILEITNSSSSEITIEQAKMKTGYDHQFELCFRSNTFAEQPFPDDKRKYIRLGKSPLSQYQLALGEKENQDDLWMKSFKNGLLLGPIQNSDGSLSFFLSLHEKIILKPRESIRLPFEYMSAEAAEGTRSTRMLLNYQGMSYGDNNHSLSGHRLKNVSIINQSGKKELPLAVGFAGTNTIFNGQSFGPNDQSPLTIRLVNTLEEGKLFLNQRNSNAATRFDLSFDTPKKNSPLDLATAEQLNKINVQFRIVTQQSDSTPYFPAEKDRVGKIVKHVILPKIDHLKPGEYIEIQLSNIETEKPVGQANIYLSYSNIPGYWDGQIVLHVQKSPITINDKNQIGLGVANANSQLEIGVKDKILSFQGGEKEYISRDKKHRKAGFSIDSKNGPLFISGQELIALTTQELSLNVGSVTMEMQKPLNICTRNDCDIVLGSKSVVISTGSWDRINDAVPKTSSGAFLDVRGRIKSKDIVMEEVFCNRNLRVGGPGITGQCLEISYLFEHQNNQKTTLQIESFDAPLEINYQKVINNPTKRNGQDIYMARSSTVTIGDLASRGKFNVKGDSYFDGDIWAKPVNSKKTSERQNEFVRLTTNGLITQDDREQAYWVNSSDRALKKDISPLSDALLNILKLEVVSYRWNERALQRLTKDISKNYLAENPIDNEKLWREKELEIIKNNSAPLKGFIAQNVEKVFPEWVRLDDEGFKTIIVSELPFVIVEAIKDLKRDTDSKIKALTNQVEKLEETNEKLKKRIHEIETKLSLM
jgi:hypothetical protein